MSTEDQSIVAILEMTKNHLKLLYNDRLRRIVLFGSQARGDAHINSDVDILVVLEDPVDIYHETRELVAIELTLFNFFHKNVHLLPFSEKAFLTEDHPLLYYVRDEGVDV